MRDPVVTKVTMLETVVGSAGSGLPPTVPALALIGFAWRTPASSSTSARTTLGLGAVAPFTVTVWLPLLPPSPDSPST